MPSRFINPGEKKVIPHVDDAKMRMSLMAMMDKWDEFARNMIYQIYNDASLLSMYQKARDSGIYDHGSKSKVRQLVVKFPHPIIYDYCRAVFEPQYGKGWELKPQVLRHELIAPWLTVNLK